jgi:phosphomannomutase
MINLRKTLKVGVSGVRGIVGESLTPLLVAAFASSFGRYVGGGRVVIGRDTRPSGEMLEHAVVAGLLAVGCQPVILGIAPTPTVQMIVEEISANGGIAITASHNPVEWNALKFIGPKGMFLDSSEADELLDIYNQQDLNYAEEQDYRDVRQMPDAFEIHQKKIFDHIDVRAIRARKFKVAVDCCNGVGAVFTRPFLEAMGCEVVTIFDRPDGIFERPPEPIAENLSALEEFVKTTGADIGFAHDPDGDRMAIVDNQGRAIGEQYTLVLAADHVLSENPGIVAANIQTTRALEDVAASYGCEVAYTKVGEIYVVEKMVELDAEIGGEGNSGGVIWRRIHPGRDSYVAMALILEMLAVSGQQLNEIVQSLPRYCNRTKKFQCPAFAAREIVRHFCRKYEDQNPILLDGLRIRMNKSWILIRPSNTEPVLRLTAESADEKEVSALLEQFSREISELQQQFTV